MESESYQKLSTWTLCATERLRSQAKIQNEHVFSLEHLLLTGPPGSGKSWSILNMKAAIESSECVFLYKDCAGFFKQGVRATELEVKGFITNAMSNSPCFMVLDSIDSIASIPQSGQAVLASGGAETIILDYLLHLFDRIESERLSVCVVGITSRPQSLHPAIRSPHRLSKEIKLGLLTKYDRKSILKFYLGENPSMPNKQFLQDEELVSLADMTPGFSPADLKNFIAEGLIQSSRSEKQGTNSETMSALSMDDFKQARSRVSPSGLRGALLDVTAFVDDLAALDQQRTILQGLIVDPFQNLERYTRLGLTPPRGVFITGPPGTGKTTLAVGAARASGVSVLALDASQVLSKFVGESERQLSEIFHKARENAPCVIIIDNVEAIASVRSQDREGSKSSDRLLSTLLTEMDGIDSKVSVGCEPDFVVVAISSRPDLIDPAFLRPGRLDQKIVLELPNHQARTEILVKKLSKIPVDITTEQIDRLAKITEGKSGADIEGICREAAMCALREDVQESQVQWRHFLQATGLPSAD
eukprot:TRINITY_DN6959_c0_g1_i1.p1 TRINITY_DN6959_c0_g1~~TRINITY_DN6959_c0_g1_i1.p1  ORF type:complete len:531 (+),score=80.21 TRINITY_DN6959_c0_g1_i1:45-1637(+)